MLPVSAQLLGAGQGGWAARQLPLHRGRARAGDCAERPQSLRAATVSLMICTARCFAGSFVLEDKA